MEDKELKHFGVLGMRWGRRKAQSGTTVSRTTRVNADRSVKQKYGSAAAARRNEYRLHKAKVKGLKNQITKADLENFRLASKKISQEEKRMNSMLDKYQAKKLSEINSQNTGRVSKALGRLVTKANVSARRENIITQLENKYHFKPDKLRTQERRNSQKAITKKYDKKYTEAFKAVDKKKLGFIASVKEYAKIDRQLSNEMVVEYLTAELNIEKKHR